jgi:metallothionein
MASEKDKKCAHPNCSCLVTDGTKYCSAQCEATAEHADIDCKCGHSGCSGKVI